MSTYIGTLLLLYIKLRPAVDLGGEGACLQTSSFFNSIIKGFWVAVGVETDKGKRPTRYSHTRQHLPISLRLKGVLMVKAPCPTSKKKKKRKLKGSSGLLLVITMVHTQGSSPKPL